MMASEIFDSLPASKKDLALLKELGFDISQPITRGQANYSSWMAKNGKIKNNKNSNKKTY